MSRDALPPHNTEAENRLIGAAFIEAASVDEASPHVSPADFYGDIQKAVWSEIVIERDHGRRIDVVTLAQRAASRSNSDESEVREMLEGFIECTPHAADAEYHAQVVRQVAIRRRLLEMAHGMIRDCHANLFDSDQLLARFDRILSEVAEGRAAKEPTRLGDDVLAAIERIHSRHAGEAQGIGTGLVDLDAMLGGLRSGQLIVLAARPSIGKTALALNIAERVATDAGRGVLFFSLEMAVTELADRALCTDPAIDTFLFRRGDLERIGREALAARYDDLRHLPIFIDDTADRTPSQIAAIARKTKRRHDIGLVIVDYLQLIGHDDPRVGEYDRVSAASRHMKNLSKHLDLPVIALSQLNRESEKRIDKRPKLSDLRATGQIEQDADVVLLLHRAEMHDPSDHPGRAEIIIAKHRNGPTGTVHVAFDAASTRFDDINDYHHL